MTDAGLWPGVLIAIVVGFLVTLAWAADRDEHVIRAALLAGSDGPREVTLPHVVNPDSIGREGGYVTYLMHVDLPAGHLWNHGIYIPKLSLWGEVTLNDIPIGACAPGSPATTRCLHQPAFWFPDRSMWRDGRNEIRVHVWGDRRQMVGLSQVVVAPAEVIRASYFMPWLVLRHLTTGLIWASAILGLIALIVAARLPDEPVFGLFGITAIVNAMASTNGVIVHVPVDPALFSWFVFASRHASAALMLLMVLTAMEIRAGTRWLRLGLWALVVFSPPIIWASGNSREVVLALYLPVAVLGIYVLMLSGWHTWRAPSRFRIVALGGLSLLVGAAMLDLARLSGEAAFVGTYYLGYAFTVMLVTFGWIIFLRFADGVRLARVFNQTLETEVATRTADLSEALTTIRNLETSALRLTENIPVGTFVLRDNGSGWMVFDFVSARLRRMFAMPTEGAIPAVRDFVEKIDPTHREGLVAALKSSLQSGAAFEWEGATDSASGRRWLGVRALPNPSDAARRSWAGVCTDLTEVHDAELRLRQANEALLQSAIIRSREEERERLMQEMHDGFGSQLASARLAVQNGSLGATEVGRILEECTIDLQLIVDAIGNADGTFADMVTDFRDRTRTRLSGMEIDLVWDVDLSQPGPDLPAATGLRVLRILQEALNNALRHSGGTRFSIGLHTIDRGAGQTLRMTVEDNGIGLSDGARPRRGMSNMRRRAREIGATLAFEPLAPGLRVRLELDLPHED